MEASDLIPLLERLEDNVDDLEEVLQPLLEQSLTDTSKKLPLLDKAKLHVLLTYMLESLIFSYLRLHGVDAKNHPVFRELTRVKQYFEKIKALETEPEKRTMTLDKDAAGRFIKHGLAGNDKIDLARAEKEAKDKAVAKLRAAMLAKRSESNGSKSTPTTKKPTGTSEANSSSSSESDSESDSDDSESAEDETSVPTPEQKTAVQSATQKTAKQKAQERRDQSKKAKNARKSKKTQEEKDARRKARKERRRKKAEARYSKKKEKAQSKQQAKKPKASAQ